MIGAFGLLAALVSSFACQSSEKAGIVLNVTTAANDAGFDRHMSKPPDMAVLEEIMVEAARRAGAIR